MTRIFSKETLLLILMINRFFHAIANSSASFFAKIAVLLVFVLFSQNCLTVTIENEIEDVKEVELYVSCSEKSLDEIPDLFFAHYYGFSSEFPQAATYVTGITLDQYSSALYHNLYILFQMILL